MPSPLTDAERAFRVEQAGAAVSSIRLACVLGAGAFVTFAFIDPLLVDGPRLGLVATRGAVVLGLLGLLAATRHPGFRRAVPAATWVACLLIGGGVVAVTAQVGGAASTYHEALLLTIFGFSLLPLTWTWRQAATCYAGLVLAYDVAMLAGGGTGSRAQWVTANAVLWFSVLISASTVALASGLRRTEFTSRRELEKAHDRLKELDRAKSRFFANLSHELRTPLTLTFAPLDAVLEDTEGDLPEMDRENLQLARRSALRLLRLVDDLLALSRMEAAAFPIDVAPLDLRDILARLVAEVGPLARRKRISVTLGGSDAPVLVHGDAQQLERVVLNLLANSLKFTPEGGAIELCAERLDRAGGAVVELSVRDTGPGIPQDQLVRVFERFHQVDDSGTRAHGGTGIGLALVKEIVELHQGRVWAESGPAGGTTIRVHLPVGAPTTTVTPEPAPAPVGLPEWHDRVRRGEEYRLIEVDDATERRLTRRRTPQGPHPTVLVIEDNADMIRFIDGLLAGRCRVLSAVDGHQGLRLAHQRQPDLVITDWMMPGLTGPEVIRELRASPETRAIPVMLLTARGGTEDRVVGHAAGADAYLAKPFQVAEFVAAVDGLLRNRTERVVLHAQHGDDRTSRLIGGILDLMAAPLAELAAAPGGAPAALQDLVEELRLLVPVAGAAPAPTPVAAALRNAVARLPPSQARRLRTDLQATGDALAEPGALERIVVELLDNAFAFGRELDGVHLVSRDEAGGSVRISVSDTGIGVDARDRDRIFLPFYSTREGPRRGLGLAVARSLARRNGGSLELADPDGAAAGATFTLRLRTAIP
jgi:signal transduction histidine kinase